MRTSGLSAAALLALAVPAWGQDPQPPPEPGGLPALVGDPLVNYPVPFYGEDIPVTGFAPAGGSWSAPGGSPQGFAPTANVCDPCSYPFDPCLPKNRRGSGRCQVESWIRADWLYWQMRNVPVPPLITTGNPSLANPSVPGGGNITPLVGPSRDLGGFHGIRVTCGRWFDPDGELGGEVSGFVFGREGSSDFFRSSSFPVLSVPVLGTDGTPAVFSFAFPGVFAGSLGVRTASQLWSGEGNLLRRVRGDGCLSVDGLFGYRYLQLNERIELVGRFQTLTSGMGTFGGAALPAGVTVTTTDTFRACTEFHGAQIGGRVEVRRDMFTVTLSGKGGAGVNLQTLRVEGNSQVSGFGVTRTLVGGVRALPSNFGRDTNTDFSLIGEAGIEVGFQATKNLSIRVGYNLLFWSDVLRPASVIDPVVSFSQVPIDPTFGTPPTGPARPVTVFRSSDFLAHGLVVGALLEYSGRSRCREPSGTNQHACAC